MVDAGTDYRKGVVEVGEREEGFALDVGRGYVNRVEVWWMVIKGSEKVVVVC